MYFDQFASRIVNLDHSIMSAAAVFCVVDCIADFQIQYAKWQRVRDQIKAAMIFAPDADDIDNQAMHRWRASQACASCA